MDDSTCVPMKETVKRGVLMMHERFNKEHAEFLMCAAQEAGLDPNVWQPNIQTFTFDRIPPAPPNPL